MTILSMLETLRRFRNNPLALLRYAMANPRKVLAAVAVVFAVIVLVVLGFGLGLIPDWIVLIGVAALSAYGTKLYWDRLSFLLSTSEETCGTVSSGAVKLTGTARAAREGERVHCEADEGEYLAYRHKVERRKSNNRQNEGDFTDYRTVKNDASAVPFHVEDETGSVLVDTTSADLQLSWDKDYRRGRRKIHLAYLEPGDEVAVYGTAMPPDQRQPAGMMDAVSEVGDEMRGQDFDAYAAEEDIVVSQTPEEPVLIVSDRWGITLVLRSVVFMIALALTTVGLLVIAGFAAIGQPLF